MTPPIIITIFARHAVGCKHVGGKFDKRCACRKHFRWTAGGAQHRRTACTSSWAEAERIKWDLEAQLSGRAVETLEIVRGLTDAIRDKRVQGVTPGVVSKYTLLLDALAQDSKNGLYRVTTRRAKTGTPAFVILPPDAAAGLLAVPNENPEYLDD
jgi:hypothetical protein